MRERPRLQPTMSLALLVQVGAMPGWPGASPSQSRSRSATAAGGVRPELEAAGEGVLIVAEAGAFGKLLEQRRVAAADGHVVRLERGAQAFHHGRHFGAPFLGPKPLHPGAAEILLE